MRGKFIVIEGGDGAGKDTQIELLQKEFGNEQWVYTRDPGGTGIGMWMRALLQHGDHLSDETELLLFLASRAQLVSEIIEPVLVSGKNILSNRFELSTYAYQIYGRQRLAKQELVLKMSAFARGNTVPDLTILLDIAPEIGRKRLQARGETITRFEAEKIEFHARVREGYLASAKAYPNVRTIDASRSVAEVYSEVRAAVLKVIEK